MKKTGAELFCESLIREGVEVLFGYPGGVIMPVYDALLKYPQLRHVLVRHEQGAAHAAEGYARATGKPGVCMVTSGPGATNLVTGIADAFLDCVPIVCISGQVSSNLIGSDAFQEVDVVGFTSLITKHNYLITNADEIPATVHEAFYLARTGRPGPVMIDMTKDAQLEQINFEYPNLIELPKYTLSTYDNSQQVEAAATVINSSQRPLILAGHGIAIAHAESELAEFAEKGSIPVATTLHGIGSFPKSHKCYVGFLGMHGNIAPNKCTNKADVIIALGMRFDDRVTGTVSNYARNAAIIHVDIDPAELGKNVKPHFAIAGDVKDILKQLIPLVESRNRNEWFALFEEYHRIEYEKIINPEINHATSQMKMGEIITLLSRETNGEAMIVADVGQNQMFAARYYRFTTINSFITSGGLGTMGFALPASMGAKIGRPDREVWVTVGDGGFQMTLQEMATIAQENLDIKIAILNNGCLGMVRQWQYLFFNQRYSQVFLKNPDFVKLSQAFGIPAERVTKRQEILPALQRARQHRGPYLLEFIIETSANLFPIMPPGAAVDEMRLE